MRDHSTPSDPGSRRWLKLKEAAKQTGLSEPCLRNKIKNGQLRARRSSPNNGGTFLIDSDDLDAAFPLVIPGQGQPEMISLKGEDDQNELDDFIDRQARD